MRRDLQEAAPPWSRRCIASPPASFTDLADLLDRETHLICPGVVGTTAPVGTVTACRRHALLERSAGLASKQVPHCARGNPSAQADPLGRQRGTQVLLKDQISDPPSVDPLNGRRLSDGRRLSSGSENLRSVTRRAVPARPPCGSGRRLIDRRLGSPSMEPVRRVSRAYARDVDWYLHADNPALSRTLRHEIRDYLVRHAEPGSDVSDAELIVEELVGNAARHAGGPIWVTLSWTSLQPTFVVRDLGRGFDPSIVEATAGRPVSVVDSGIEHLVEDPPGLTDPRDLALEEEAVGDGRRLAERDDLAEFAFSEGGRGLFLVSHLAPALQAAARRGGGTEVAVELPVKRAGTRSYDPPRHTVDALPALEEARPEGGFGRESFLRALVVQLARAIEFQHGPDGAEAAVAQVGIDVGGQMEEEFRVAQGITGRLSPRELAECYVRLKHAIDGGFYVLEATPERIVLGNRRCPFGDVVRYAPALCRMTSAVFGGIAARNNDEGVDVTLEERIAVGDPGCRVIVDLSPPAVQGRPLAHHYSRPT